MLIGVVCWGKAVRAVGACMAAVSLFGTFRALLDRNAGSSSLYGGPAGLLKTMVRPDAYLNHWAFRLENLGNLIDGFDGSKSSTLGMQIQAGSSYLGLFQLLKLLLLFHFKRSQQLAVTMSQAHRPTWNPTMGRESKAGSQQISKLSLASHTKLKFRQPGQSSSGDVGKKDLKAELAAAERTAQDKKRKAAGLPPLPPLPSSSLRLENGKADEGQNRDAGVVDEEQEERAKRRKILEEAAELDRDDTDDEDEGRTNGVDKGKGKAVNGGAEVDGDDEEEEDDDDDDEWVTAARGCLSDS